MSDEPDSYDYLMDLIEERILKMTSRIEKLEAALQEIVEQEPQTAHPVVVNIIKIARKALEQTNDSSPGCREYNKNRPQSTGAN